MASVSVSVPPEIYKMLMFAGVAVGGYFLLKKGIKQANSNAVDNAFDDSSEVGTATRFATSFYQAIHENDFFGFSEDETAILQNGQRIRSANIPFSLVAKQYRNKYNKDLLRDIQKSLSPRDFQKFQDAISGLGQLILPKNIYLKGNARIFNDTFQRSAIIPFKQGPIGRLKETVLLGSNNVPFHGFEKGGKRFYVPARQVTLKRAIHG